MIFEVVLLIFRYSNFLKKERLKCLLPTVIRIYEEMILTKKS